MRYITFEDSVIRDLVNLKLEWQEPVITEKKIFLNVKSGKINLPYVYVGYPWATLIDLHQHKYKDVDFKEFLKKLNLWKEVENGITVLQSYHFRKYLEPLKKMGIKYFFCVHAVESEFIDFFIILIF